MSFAAMIPVLLITLVFINRYFLGLFLLLAKEKEDDSPLRDHELPTVCVIIPLYNEGRSIYDTIKSIASQDYPREKLSVMVVDDCSKDDSYVWASQAAQEDTRVLVIRNPHNMGKRLGIVHAVRVCNAEFVVSVDSDVEIAKDAVRILMNSFTDANIAAVGGMVMVSNPNVNWLTKMQTIKYHIGYSFLKNLERNFHSVMCLSGCLTAYRRRILLEVEPVLLKRNLCGISIKYGEDRFLTRQIVKCGYETTLNLSAKCYTKAPKTIGTYFSQQLRWRRSNLVDFIGGLSHFWRLNPFVGLHYISLNVLLVCYPVFLWLAWNEGEFWSGFAVHVGVLAILGAIYGAQTRHLQSSFRVHPLNILWLGLLMPVTYMVLSVLATFTLDSGSWETRR